MLNNLAMMYVTLIPVILSGVFNMVWCKTPFLAALNKPIDGGKMLKDKRRLFGENKTWKGFMGYIVLNVIVMVLYGYLSNLCGFNRLNYFYVNHANTIGYNLLIGVLLGLAYALFELPNSFLKRRLGIKEGKLAGGKKKIFFVFLDQADSVIGCCLVVWMFYDLGIKRFVLYVAVGALTHIVINMILFLMKLRKNMF